MKKIFLFFCTSLLFAVESSPLDKTRPQLDKLKENTEVKFDDYALPYLTVQTGHVFNVSADKIRVRIESALKQSELSLEKSAQISAAQLKMPKEFREGEQLEAIQECTEQKCNMKLNLLKEIKKVEAAPKNAKVSVYHQLVAARMNAYVKTGDLLGYEDREKNDSAVLEMARYQEFLKFKYPNVANFIFSEGWKTKESAKKGVKNNFLMNEMVIIAPDKLQPVWRLGEVFEFVEKGNTLFFYLHAYTNHYFDASISFFEVIPQGGKSIVVLTDVLEVDELKKSGFIRAFFKGKMVEAVSLSQDNFLKRLQ